MIKDPRTGTLFIHIGAMFSDDLIKGKKKPKKKKKPNIYNNLIGSVFQNFPKAWKGC